MSYVRDPFRDFTGRGYPKVIPPFPVLDGALYAAYLTGGFWDGDAYAADDWSGWRRNAANVGVTVNDDSVTGVSASTWIATPFTTDQMIAGDETPSITNIGAFFLPAGAPVVPFFNSGGGAPYIALHGVPSGNRVQAYAFAPDGTNQNTNVFYTADVSQIEDHWAVFGCRWSTTQLQPFYFRPSDGALVSAAVLNHTKGLAGSGVFRGLQSAAPNGSQAAAAYYSAWLDDTQALSVYAAMKAKLTEVGITV